MSVEKNFKISTESEVSEKYWLKNPSEFGSYNIDDQRLIGDPDNQPTLEAKFVFRINGQQISYNSPIIYKINSPINGDEYRPFNIGNPIYLNPLNNLEYYVNTNKKKLKVDMGHAGNIFSKFNDELITLDKLTYTPSQINEILGQPGSVDDKIKAIQNSQFKVINKMTDADAAKYMDNNKTKPNRI